MTRRNCLFHGFGDSFAIEAGSFKDIQYDEVDYSVCLAQELSMVADAVVPIEDFGVPQDPGFFMRTMEEVVVRGLRGEQVFVGCMGGLGRTGTALALVAKLCGSVDPVKYVRKNYSPYAVETKLQEEFVKAQSVFWSRIRIRVRRLFDRATGITTST